MSKSAASVTSVVSALDLLAQLFGKDREWASNIVSNHYSIDWLLSFKASNPNGNPDGDNMPRHDILPDGSIRGFMTSNCLKRFTKDAVPVLFPGEPGCEIFVERGVTLASKQKEACGGVASDAPNLDAQMYLLDKDIDIRWYGVTGTTGRDVKAADKNSKLRFNVGTVRGAVRVDYAYALNQIQICDDQIGRVCKTTAADGPAGRKRAQANPEEEIDENVSANGTFGSFHRIVYGLYHTHVSVCANLAKVSHMTNLDLGRLLLAMRDWSKCIHSSARRGETVGLYVWRHASELGDVRESILERLISKNISINEPATSLSDVRLPTVEFLREKISSLGLDKKVSIDNLIDQIDDSQL